jgi:acyl transferase domain-containing protein
MGFEDGLRVTRLRGRFMQEACDATRGGMAAILNLDEGPTREVCAEAGVELANLNCPGQLVISGESERVARACDLARSRGAKRAVPLPVAGAYHSRLMAGAQPKLAVELAGITVTTPTMPVVANVTARPMTMQRPSRTCSSSRSRLGALGGIDPLAAVRGFAFHRTPGRASTQRFHETIAPNGCSMSPTVPRRDREAPRRLAGPTVEDRRHLRTGLGTVRRHAPAHQRFHGPARRAAG